MEGSEKWGKNDDLVGVYCPNDNLNYPKGYWKQQPSASVLNSSGNCVGGVWIAMDWCWVDFLNNRRGNSNSMSEAWDALIQSWQYSETSE